MSEKPFPPPRNGSPSGAWAALVMRLWAARGWPVLVGVPAEQASAARRILGL